MVGVRQPRQLREFRRYAIVIIAVIVAVITPSGRPDQHAGPGHPDVPLLRGVDRHRPAPRPAAPQGGRGGAPTSRPRDRLATATAASTSTSTASSRGDRRPRRGRVGAGGRARPGRARRSWPSTPSTGRWPQGQQAFYTTPIKALSNQKYADLVAPARRRPGGPAHRRQRHQRRRPGGGDDHRGPPQHDLRRVAGPRRAALRRARRGPLPPGRLPGAGVGGGDHPPARATCASCASRPPSPTPTSWPTGSTHGAGPHRRPSSRTSGPVELVNLYLVDDRPSERARTCSRRWSTGGPTPRASGSTPSRCAARRGRREAGGDAATSTPRRLEVVERLADEDLLPGDLLHLQPGRRATTPCRPCVDAGPAPHRPTEERDRIRAIVERARRRPDRRRPRRARLRPLARRPRGRGSPPTTPAWCRRSRRRSRPASPQGLVKVVFATETLALGINMPARSVVIEKLDQVHRRAPRVPHAGRSTPSSPAGPAGGASTRSATPSCCGRRSSPFERGGRPGRQPRLRAALGVPAHLQHGRQPGAPLRPPTRPTTCSTGRSPSTRPTAPWSGSSPARTAPRRGAGRAAEAEATLRAGRRGRVPPAAAPERPRPTPTAARRPRHDDRATRWPASRPGDVIAARRRRSPGRPVLSVAYRKGRRRRLARRRRPAARAAPSTPPTSTSRPRSSAAIELPDAVPPNNPAFQQRGGRRCSARPGCAARPWPTTRPTGRRRPRRRGRAATHPVADCPDRDAHLRAAAQADRVAPRAGRPRPPDRRRTTESLARRFDRVLAGARRPGATSTAGRSPPRGELLVRIYHECDLLVAECLGAGLLDGLDPPSLAGAGVVLHLRAPQHGPAARRRGSRPARCASGSSAIERAGRRAATPTRSAPACRSPGRPIPTFFALAHAWAAGETLDDVLDDEDLSGGDFVRNVKQLIDLLRQIGDAAPDPTTAPTRPRGGRGPVPRRGGGRRRRCDDGDEAPGRRRRRLAADGVTVEKGAGLGRARAAARRRRGRRAPTPRPARVVEAARRAGEPVPPLGPARRRPVPHPRRPGRRGAAAVAEATTVPRRPRRRCSIDGRQHWFVAHLVARRSWWRGRVVAAMNAQWLGAWDVAPRAHPDDGLLDLLDGDLSLGDRLEGPAPPADRHPRAPPRHRRAPGRGRAARPRPPPLDVWLDGERRRRGRATLVGPGRARRRSPSSCERHARRRGTAWAHGAVADGRSSRPKARLVDEVDRRADVLLDASHQHPRPPRAGLRGALRPRPAHRRPRGRRASAVERGAYGLADRVRGPGRRRAGPPIAVCCEYDALPGIGHACGHNIIAAAGLGAGLAAAALADELGGRVVILGTPAEEGGGGKVLHGRARAPSTASTRR